VSGLLHHWLSLYRAAFLPPQTLRTGRCSS
jgi:hypothetical protein